MTRQRVELIVTRKAAPERSTSAPAHTGRSAAQAEVFAAGFAAIQKFNSATTAPGRIVGTTPAEASETTIRVDDLRNRPAQDEQEFVPREVRVAAELAKVRANARRGRSNLNAIDLARGRR